MPSLVSEKRYVIKFKTPEHMSPKLLRYVHDNGTVYAVNHTCKGKIFEFEVSNFNAITGKRYTEHFSVPNGDVLKITDLWE